MATYSPYVALHCATEDTSKSEQDGVIWCLNYQEIRDYIPDQLKNVMNDGGFKFTVKQLENAITGLEEIDRLDKEFGTFLMFIEPPSLDSRIINQYALFSLMSSSSALLNEWLEEHDKSGSLYKKIIIPAELKWEIRDHLDQANINEKNTFSRT